MNFLHAIISDSQTRLQNVLGKIAMLLGDKKKLFIRGSNVCFYEEYLPLILREVSDYNIFLNIFFFHFLRKLQNRNISSSLFVVNICYIRRFYILLDLLVKMSHVFLVIFQFQTFLLYCGMCILLSINYPLNHLL